MIALIIAAIVVLAVLFVAIPMAFRVVVSTNDVHIVQYAKKTIAFGKGLPGGNVYYKWPAWLPHIGVNVIALSVSNFSYKLENYDAYDKDRVPFVVDVVAFGRVGDAIKAAERVQSYNGLMDQLGAMLKGAVRRVLAQYDINQIMELRGELGKKFTDEVSENLKEWGVDTVQSIEFMDIRDSGIHKNIANIMAKKQSHIEMESRMEVAKNQQAAQVAEIDAKRQVQVQEQDAAQQVGIRKAQTEQEVGIMQQKSMQAVKEQAAETAMKDQKIAEINATRKAEIEKAARLISAAQDKEVAVIEAEGTKQKAILDAEGKLEATKREAEGVKLQGLAKGEAETAVLMAPVTAQISLADKIGQDEGYQKYLLGIRQIEANQVIGVEQAKALEKAGIKIIANAGNPVEGVNTVMDMFTPKGGTQLGGMLEALVNTDAGKALVSKLVAPKE
jgi:flotillin